MGGRRQVQMPSRCQVSGGNTAWQDPVPVAGPPNDGSLAPSPFLGFDDCWLFVDAKHERPAPGGAVGARSAGLLGLAAVKLGGRRGLHMW